MERAFQLFHKLADAVVVQARPRAQRFGSDGERWNPLALPPQVQSRPQQVVHDLLEGTPRPAHFGLHSRSHIIIEGQSRSHILMLG